MSRPKPLPPMPAVEELEAELQRVRANKRLARLLRSTIGTLVTVAAAAVLAATLLMPVLRVTGASMDPTLSSGDIVLCHRGEHFERGDLVAFYYNNNILVKRVIGTAGDWIDIGDDGSVYINDILYEEPYLTEKSLGQCDQTLPYQVPEGRLFVMGDHRSVSVDSRSAAVGCVGQEQILGRVDLRVWPLSHFGPVN